MTANGSGRAKSVTTSICPTPATASSRALARCVISSRKRSTVRGPNNPTKRWRSLRWRSPSSEMSQRASIRHSDASPCGAPRTNAGSRSTRSTTAYRAVGRSSSARTPCGSRRPASLNSAPTAARSWSKPSPCGSFTMAIVDPPRPPRIPPGVAKAEPSVLHAREDPTRRSPRHAGVGSRPPDRMRNPQDAIARLVAPKEDCLVPRQTVTQAMSQHVPASDELRSSRTRCPGSRLAWAKRKPAPRRPGRPELVLRDSAAGGQETTAWSPKELRGRSATT